MSASFTIAKVTEMTCLDCINHAIQAVSRNLDSSERATGDVLQFKEFLFISANRTRHPVSDCLSAKKKVTINFTLIC